MGGLKKGSSLTRGHSPPPESGGTLVLVSQDGIQRPPLHFPQGGHLLSFLSCLENGLLPRGQLEPPLWTQQGKVSWLGRLWVQGWAKDGLLSSTQSPQGQLGVEPRVGLCTGQPDRLLPLQGKVFPKLRKRSSIRSIEVEELGIGRATDYVFRIIYPGHRHEHSECPHVPCEGCSGSVRALWSQASWFITYSLPTESLTHRSSLPRCHPPATLRPRHHYTRFLSNISWHDAEKKGRLEILIEGGKHSIPLQPKIKGSKPPLSSGPHPASRSQPGHRSCTS